MKSSNITYKVIVCLLLAACVILIYWKVIDFGFVNFDDDQYVYANYNIQTGLNWNNIRWAFTTFYASNWHPLTWISHMLDIQLFGLNPGWHHLINVIFHVANSILLFLALERLTGALWKSGFVAALFALHPLHVESVAWISERKDVLSTLFWMLTMFSYSFYVRKRNVKRYLIIFTCLFAGLLAKPMLVSLPFVLLLIDYWPLRRFAPSEEEMKTHVSKFRIFYSLILEKVPLIALVAGSSILTFIAQEKGGAVTPLDIYPLHVRIANALVSYMDYLAKTIWPFDLAVLYPHPGKSIKLYFAAGSFLFLLLVTAFFVHQARKRPFLIVGWLWYLGTLIPVIGLIQVGSQALADRYTYVPLVGIFVILAWGIPSLKYFNSHKITVNISAVILLAIYSTLSWFQVGCWADSKTLFQHALQSGADTAQAHNNLGYALAEEGKIPEAISHYRQALKIDPKFFLSHNAWALALEKQGKYAEATLHYQQALLINPNNYDNHNNFGVLLAKEGRFKEALEQFREALRINNNEKINCNIGLALLQLGDRQQAGYYFDEAIRLNPENRERIEKIYSDGGKEGEKIDPINYYIQLVSKNPDNAQYHYLLGTLYEKNNDILGAIAQYETAIKLNPEHADSHNNLGAILAEQGKLGEAKKHFQAAVRISPDDKYALENLKKVQSLIKEPAK